jgi:hypothetical protein
MQAHTNKWSRQSKWVDQYKSNIRGCESAVQHCCCCCCTPC